MLRLANSRIFCTIMLNISRDRVIQNIGGENTPLSILQTRNSSRKDALKRCGHTFAIFAMGRKSNTILYSVMFQCMTTFEGETFRVKWLFAGKLSR